MTEVNKSVDELLQKDYIHDKPWQFSLKHRATNPTLKHSFGITASGDVAASTSQTIQLGPRGNAVLNFGSDGSVSISSSQAIGKAGGFSVGTLNKTKLNLGGKQIDGIDTTIDLGLKRNNMGVKAKVSPSQKTWSLSSSFSHAISKSPQQETVLGTCDVSGKFDASNYQMKASALLGGKLQTDPYTIYLACKAGQHNKTPLGKLSLIALAKGDMSECVSEYSYIIAEDRIELTLGAKWHLDNEKTSALKAKLDCEGKLSAVFSKIINDNLTIAIGSQWNLLPQEKFKRNSPDEKNAKFGIKFDLTA